MSVAAMLPGLEDAPRKPDGGFRFVTVTQLAMAWWAVRHELIRFADLRVYFAAHELAARRCTLGEGQLPRFTLGELGRLTGLSAKRLAAALKRLEAVGLVAWSEAALSFAATPAALTITDRAGLEAFIAALPNPARRVPVPRRILRLLAGGARRALAATILGHLIRCLYYRSGRCQARGRIKASWIAATFGVGLSRVKAARQELIALGWLLPEATPQWARNRWGGTYWINLHWERLAGLPAAASPPPGAAAPAAPPAPAGPPAGPGLGPPPAAAGPQLGPPDSDQELSSGELKNQKPAAGGPAGVSLPEGGGEGPVAPALPSPPAAGVPVAPEVSLPAAAAGTAPAASRPGPPAGVPAGAFPTPAVTIPAAPAVAFPTPAVTIPAAPAGPPATVRPAGPAGGTPPAAPGAGLGPPPAPSGPQLGPPVSDRKLSSGEAKNQEPAAGGPPGVSLPGGRREETPLAPPTLRNVVLDDLRQIGRLLILYAQAVTAGLVGNSEHERLRFVAAAEHARVIGTRNPPGLFIRLVRAKLWHYLTQDDEDAANARLKEYFFGAPRARSGGLGGSLPGPLPARPMGLGRPPLSEDARLVREVKALLARAGYRGDPFFALKREQPEWTRARWDAAVAELEGSLVGAR